MGLEEAEMNQAPVGLENGADRAASSRENPVPSTAPARSFRENRKLFYLSEETSNQGEWELIKNALLWAQNLLGIHDEPASLLRFHRVEINLLQRNPAFKEALGHFLAVAREDAGAL